MADEDADRRREEYIALTSIYDAVEGDADSSCWRVPLGCGGGAVLEVHVPVDYPSQSAPTPVILSPFITDNQCSTLAAELLAMFDGTEIIFIWVEHLRTQLQAAEDSNEEAKEAAAEVAAATELEMALDRVARLEAAEEPAAFFSFSPTTSKYGQRVRHFGSDASDETFAVPIISGDGFHPPRSGPAECFQAHVCRVTCMGHVNWALATLLRDKRIARATHNMLAYRFVDADRSGVLVSDNDDDGEAGSGAKLAGLLELTGAQNVLVVVSRWFGGVLLGPARFKWIATTARTLLEEAGYIGGPKADSGANTVDKARGRGKKQL